MRERGDAIAMQLPKWPEELRLVDDFPRTPSGKIRKPLLREQLRAAQDA